jgi:hypothetical protein
MVPETPPKVQAHFYTARNPPFNLETMTFLAIMNDVRVAPLHGATRSFWRFFDWDGTPIQKNLQW